MQDIISLFLTNTPEKGPIPRFSERKALNFSLFVYLILKFSRARVIIYKRPARKHRFAGPKRTGGLEENAVDNNIRMRTSAFGGFNKNDVLAYIDALSRKYKAVENELNGRINELTSSREALAVQVGEFSARISELEEACAKAQEAAEKTKAEREAARSEATELRRKAVLLEVENNRLKSQISSGEKEAEKVREEKEKIADAIIDARKNAQLIMNSARDQAVGKIRDAEEEIHGLHHKVEGFISDVEAMKRAMAEMLRRVEGNVSEIGLRLEELHKEVYKIDNSLKLISLDTGVEKLRIKREENAEESGFSSDDSAM